MNIDIKKIVGPIIYEVDENMTDIAKRRKLRRIEKVVLHNMNRRTRVVMEKVVLFRIERFYKILGYITTMERPARYKKELFDNRVFMKILLRAWFLDEDVLGESSYRKSVNSLLRIVAVETSVNKEFISQIRLFTVRQSGLIAWYVKNKDGVSYESLVEKNNIRPIY